MKKTILITGASRGFGKIWAEAFLKRGDNVIATSRNAAHLQDLTDKYGKAVLAVQLDITSKADCIAAVNQARQHFGNIDTVINNAGYSLFGTIEENSEKEARDLFEANVFGTLWMTQAILDLQQKSGHSVKLR
jgi:NADP-dependent 3-hydroxy acid dehydrogenase YdfG